MELSRAHPLSSQSRTIDRWWMMINRRGSRPDVKTARYPEWSVTNTSPLIGEVPSHRPVLQGVCVVTGVRRAVPQDLPVVVEVESSYYYSISSYFTYSFFVGRGTGHGDGDQSVNASTRVREEARNWSKIRGYEQLEPLVNGEDRTCNERIHRCSSYRARSKAIRRVVDVIKIIRM